MPQAGEDLTKEQREAGLRKLTPQQQTFLDNYFTGDMTQTASARAAGYKNPSVSAVRLLRNPVVAERFKEMRLEANPKQSVTAEDALLSLKKMRDEAWEHGKYGDAIMAEELRLKTAGILPNRHSLKPDNVCTMTGKQALKNLTKFLNMAHNQLQKSATSY